MMKSVLLLLALVACAPQRPRAVGTAAVGQSALVPVATLAGEWRVARIDGKPLDEPYGIALSASDKEIWWSPRCAGFARSYTIRATQFSSGPPLGFKPYKPGDPPPLICLIAPPAKTRAAFDAIAAGTAIRRTPENGVEISGGGHALLLFSQ